MIDAVSTSGITPPLATRGTVQRAPTPEAPARVKRAETFMTSRIRVDNFLDLAILEVRSHETGDIIRQFPTEKQIEAFQRAEELQQSGVLERQAVVRETRAEIFTQNTKPSTPTQEKSNNGANNAQASLAATKQTQQSTAPQANAAQAAPKTNTAQITSQAANTTAPSTQTTTAPRNNTTPAQTTTTTTGSGGTSTQSIVV